MRLPFSIITVLCIFTVVVDVSSNEAEEFRIVQTAQGPVKGYKNRETGLFSFMNIPYATAPTGPYRFKAPLPPPIWMQSFEAVDRHIICPQTPFNIHVTDTKNLQMQEDCLIANVHVPDTEKTNLPVYVIIHGGGFLMGYGDWLKPVSINAENNIIEVTFNYRLGVHGFLCLGTEDAPGNAGMKDQLALLRWVKKNIANFGGNPNDVTIGGCSAGGAAVDLVAVSKSAEGLFHKAIPESGSNVGSWAIQTDPLENAKEFAKSKNISDVDNIYALEEFYKTASFETLQAPSFVARTNNKVHFTPCVERPTGDEIFFDDHPVNIIKKKNYKKVPLLYGFSQMEGLMKVAFFDNYKDTLNNNFADFLPPDLKFISEEEKLQVAQEIKTFYFGKEMIDDSKILKYVEFIGDVLFLYPHLRSVQLHLSNGHDQIYLYEYAFVDENDPVIPYTNVRGADHCFQDFCLSDGVFPLKTVSQQTEKYKKMSSLLKKLWANFIKTGQPVVGGSPLAAWPAVNRNGAPYMTLNEESHVKDAPLAEERFLFWDKIYDKYYREPIPPPMPLPKIGTHTEL